MCVFVCASLRVLEGGFWVRLCARAYVYEHNDEPVASDIEPPRVRMYAKVWKRGKTKGRVKGRKERSDEGDIYIYIYIYMFVQNAVEREIQLEIYVRVDRTDGPRERQGGGARNMVGEAFERDLTGVHSKKGLKGVDTVWHVSENALPQPLASHSQRSFFFQPCKLLSEDSSMWNVSARTDD